MTTTDIAHRRLLEALAEQGKTPGGIGGMLLAMPYAVQLAEQANQPALANVWRRFVELAEAVQRDLKGADRG